jgi:DNA-binding MarR family transcriptional regulator
MKPRTAALAVPRSSALPKAPKQSLRSGATPPNGQYQRPSFLLRRAHQISVALFEAQCASLELTPAQHLALVLINEHPGLDQTRLARAMGYDKVTTLRVVKGLEARGLVERQSVPENRRTLAIRLTVSGRKTVTAAKKYVEQAHAQLVKPLSATEQKTLTALLMRLTNKHESSARAPLELITE